ncbi:MAG: TIR domain-containing protein [Chloroflexi bacterium]|nr:toll/interleukin-1 receptor domain-containing protein [Chloroflexota bacterium]NOG66457.1 TIR domain-containing protein [Chloroflexota bacterium]
MARVDDLKKLILEHNRRLQKLKEQEARYGYSVDPHIPLEIEDIEAKIQALQTELNQLAAGTATPTITNERPSPTSGSPIVSSRPGTDQYHSCFISYSHQDEAFVERLYNDLQQQGVRCWYAPQDMRIGDKIRPTIDRSIQSHEKLLLVLSEHSIESDWVEKEVETAFEKEYKQKQVILFPIRLDSAVMETDQAWAADIRRTRHIGDFSQWRDHEVYQHTFERLLRDLQAEG